MKKRSGLCSRRARRSVLAGMVGAACAGALAPVRAAGAGGQEPASRGERGLSLLAKVAGGDPRGPLSMVEKTAPDLARLVEAFAFGDVLSRPGLSLPDRELCSVAMLLALGSARPQMLFHMGGYLNVGGSPGLLLELAILSAPILGFPAAIEAVGAIRALFAQRAIAAHADPVPRGDRMERGLRVAKALEMEPGSRHPDLARWRLGYQLGEVMAREGLTPRMTSLLCAAMFAVSGRREALPAQIRSALRVGVTPEELVELFIQVSVYAGFPAAINAVNALSQVLSEPQRDLPAIPETTETETAAERRERGLRTMAKTSAADGEKVARGFNDLAPDLGRLLLEHVYGEVFSRPGLDLKTRELCAVAALAAMGSSATEEPLQVHIRAAARAGASRAEIEEVLLNLEPYAGFARPAVALKVLEGHIDFSQP
jgi:4-carboxymuconolactone decarboxylase